MIGCAIRVVANWMRHGASAAAVGHRARIDGLLRRVTGSCSCTRTVALGKIELTSNSLTGERSVYAVQTIRRRNRSQRRKHRGDVGRLQEVSDGRDEKPYQVRNHQEPTRRR